MKDSEFQIVEPLQIMDKVRQNFTHHFLPNKLEKFYLQLKITMKNLPLEHVSLTRNNPY
jgi:hypothetical protein